MVKKDGGWGQGLRQKFESASATHKILGFSRVGARGRELLVGFKGLPPRNLYKNAMKVCNVGFVLTK